MSRERPRLGFLGLGWIGLHRMEAIAASGAAEVVAIADVVPHAIERAQQLAPQAVVVQSLNELIEQAPDGIVIATPSALHAEHAIAALERKIAVFCQKPLGRTAEETGRVLAAARAADRLLGVDLSYRFTEGMARISELVRAGELGSVYAASLSFHNAYGPDKPWFYDRKLSGGGALIDLGTHILDLALWVLDYPAIENVHSRLFASGVPVTEGTESVEDYAVAQIELATGAAIDLACSWKLHAGCDCVIDVAFYGTRAGARFHNVQGSFYDFEAELLCGTSRHALAGPPDDWGGRAAIQWVRKLAGDARFDEAAVSLLELSAALDLIYARGRAERPR
jgi:predicted dehydrogenase